MTVRPRMTLSSQIQWACYKKWKVEWEAQSGMCLKSTSNFENSSGSTGYYSFGSVVNLFYFIPYRPRPPKQQQQQPQTLQNKNKQNKTKTVSTTTKSTRKLHSLRLPDCFSCWFSIMPRGKVLIFADFQRTRTFDLSVRRVKCQGKCQ